MKNILSYTRTGFLALALGTALTPALLAQTTPASAPATTAPASTDKKTAKREAMLTADERAHLDKVRAQALAANPSLQQEADSLKAQHKALKAQGDTASADNAKAALKMQAKDHAEKVEAAMLKIDPTVAPIFAKMKAAHKAGKNAPASA